MANHEEFKRIMGVVKTAEVIESGFQVFLNVRNLQRSSRTVNTFLSYFAT